MRMRREETGKDGESRGAERLERDLERKTRETNGVLGGAKAAGEARERRYSGTDEE